jgi:hypothetical protein
MVQVDMTSDNIAMFNLKRSPVNSFSFDFLKEINENIANLEAKKGYKMFIVCGPSSTMIYLQLQMLKE